MVMWPCICVLGPAVPMVGVSRVSVRPKFGGSRMRKLLVAFSLAMCAAIGASSTGGSLAAFVSVQHASAAGDQSVAGLNSAQAVSGSAVVQYAMQYLGYP